MSKKHTARDNYLVILISKAAPMDESLGICSRRTTVFRNLTLIREKTAKERNKHSSVSTNRVHGLHKLYLNLYAGFIQPQHVVYIVSKLAAMQTIQNLNLKYVHSGSIIN